MSWIHGRCHGPGASDEGGTGSYAYGATGSPAGAGGARGPHAGRLHLQHGGEPADRPPNLPIGLLELISASLRVSVSAVGLLVTGYGVTVALVSLPLAHVTRAVPRRHVLTGLLATLVVSSLAAAPATSYWLLLGARLLTALAQALFWAVMGPVAVGLFAPEVRGRVTAALSVAGSLALVLGVPAGTWLGRRSEWQVPAALPAGLGLVSLVTIAVSLPASRPDEEPAAYGTGPDVRRFGIVLAAGTLSATGAFAGYTYVGGVWAT